MAINASFIGNIGQNAKTEQTSSGMFTNFSVAVSDSYSKGSTEWVTCSLFGERGTKLVQYLLTGVKVFVTGRLVKETFKKANGEAVTKLKLWVSDLEFAGSKQKEVSLNSLDQLPKQEDSCYMDIPF